ncbi:hypothetical protein ABZZ79_33490 [Streptomyces sp. NPDC006458]|uniref:hypothetical protein n=1 Tax=Streptomyces sp. NPDC006458 TaxID=3154302 RepID=UPI0033A25E4A
MVLGSDLIRWGKARHGRGPGTALAAALLLFLAPALAACSDDEGGGESATPVPTIDTPTGMPTVTEPTPAAAAPSDPQAAEAEIKANWAKFFDPRTAPEDKLAVLENGERMAPVLQAFSGDERGGRVGAKVEKVAFTSPTDANVTYSLTLQGQTALPNAAGTAVEEDGTWKVSAKTLCALVQLSRTGSASQSPIPGC